MESERIKQNKQKRKDADLTTRPLLGKIILFSLPLVFTSVLQLLYNAADLIVVGRWTGSNAMAAVGNTGALINLIVNLFIGLSTGALVVAARYIGAKRADKVQRCVHTSVAISVLCGIAVGLLGILVSKQMLKWMNTPSEILSLSALYLKIYFCGMPFNLLYNFGASLLRAGGDTRRPLLVLAAAGLLNIGLNILTVVGFGMGVAGVGIATVASQVLSAAGVVFFLMRKKDATKFSFKKLRIHRAELLEILRVGLPAGLQGVLFSLSNVIIQSSINSFGEAAMAGNAAAANLEGFVYVSMNSVTQACLTVVGQNYGAAKPKNIDLATVQCTLLTTVVGLALGGIMLAAGRPLMRLYGCDEAGLVYGIRRLRIICTTYFLCGIMDALAGALRGMGSSLLPMLVTLFGACVSRVIWVYTVFRVKTTFFMLIISYPLSWILTLSVHLVCLLFLRKKVYAMLRSAQVNQSADNTGEAVAAPETDEVQATTDAQEKTDEEETNGMEVAPCADEQAESENIKSEE